MSEVLLTWLLCSLASAGLVVRVVSGEHVEADLGNGEVWHWDEAGATVLSGLGRPTSVCAEMSERGGGWRCGSRLSQPSHHV